MTLHGAITIRMNIKTGMTESVMNLLHQIDNNPNDNPLVPFSKIKSIHFARFVICPEGPDARGNIIPCQLVFTTNYDQPFTNHVEELVNQGGQGLWQIFSLCENFPGGNFNAVSLTDFLRSNNKKPETFYVGVGNRSVNQIRRENELRNDIEEYLDLYRENLVTRDAKQIREEIKRHVFSKPALQFID